MTESGEAAILAEPAADESAVWRALLIWRRGGPKPVVAALDGADHFLALYAPFCGARRDRPMAVAHLAQSLDGRIATASGASQWLSGPADLDHTHRMRALADAVVVGIGTVSSDDPQLTVRRCVGENPVRVVIDPDLRLDGTQRIFHDGAAPTLVIAAADRARTGDRIGQAEIVAVPRGKQGLAPMDIRRALAERGLFHLFIEGGGVTISRFVAARALDRLQLAIAPLLLGSGRPSLTLAEIASPSAGLRPRIRRAALGEDVLIECIFGDAADE